MEGSQPIQLPQQLHSFQFIKRGLLGRTGIQLTLYADAQTTPFADFCNSVGDLFLLSTDEEYKQFAKKTIYETTKKEQDKWTYIPLIYNVGKATVKISHTYPINI